MMNKLALTVPGYKNIVDEPTKGFVDKNGSASPALLVSGILSIGIYIAFVLAMSWLAWGVFQYLFAGGNKEQLAKARSRITWSIVGLLIVLISFAVSQFFQGIFNPQDVGITPITTPAPFTP